MLIKFGKTSFFIGILFLIYGFVLLLLVSPPLKPGFLLNSILYVFDFVWFILSGIFLVYAGLIILKEKGLIVRMLNPAGHLLIFSIIFLITSFIFNIFAKPHIASTGRIFTFLIQAVSRLLSPALSSDFLIPLAGLVAYAAVARWFQRVGIKMINNK